MRKSSVILASMAVMVPLIATIYVKTVAGSEPPGRLTVNPDGTVTDNVTKLVWEQATNGGTSVPNQTAVCSQYAPAGLPTGWRLPTIKELVSIVDYESPTTPMIDTAVFPDILTAQYHRYWTSDTSTVTGGNAGNLVNFDTGVIESTAPGNGYMGRCVHSPVTGDAGP